MIKKDITTEQDIHLLVTNFYTKLLADPLMAPHFEGLRLHEHIPNIVSFWSLILLDKEGYKSNVFDKHLHLNIHQEHFDKWVKLFTETVDEWYEGEKATLAKQRAMVLGNTFGSKFKNMR